MINLKEEINSLSNFKRHTSEFIEQLKETGKPIILTINGKAELVVQDAVESKNHSTNFGIPCSIFVCGL